MIGSIASSIGRGISFGLRGTAAVIPAVPNASPIEPDIGSVGGLHAVLMHFDDYSAARVDTVPSGLSGRSIDLDGTKDFLALVETFAGGQAEVTLSAWIRKDDTDPGVIFGYPGSTLSYAPLMFSDNNAYIGNGAVAQISFGFNPTEGQFHHVAITATTTTEVKFYVDGVQVGSGFTTLSGGLTPVWSLGKGNALFYLFSDLMHDVRLYTAALSGAQVAELAAGGEATGASPAHRWAFGNYPDGWVYEPIVSDSFTRANSGDLGSSDGAGAAIVGGSGIPWTEFAGAWEINTNRVQATSGGSNGAAWIDAGEADVVVECTHIAPGAGGTNDPSVVVRAANNDWWFGYNAAGTITLYEVVDAAVYTARGSSAYSAALESSTKTVVTAKGQTIRVFSAGSVVSYELASMNEDATSCGVWSNIAGTYFDNFVVWSLNS